VIRTRAIFQRIKPIEFEPVHDLASDIVEAILDGRQPPELTLAALMRPSAAESPALVQSQNLPALCLLRFFGDLFAVFFATFFFGAFAFFLDFFAAGFVAVSHMPATASSIRSPTPFALAM
jgi:hypothetical protein